MSTYQLDSYIVSPTTHNERLFQIIDQRLIEFLLSNKETCYIHARCMDKVQIAIMPCVIDEKGLIVARSKDFRMISRTGVRVSIIDDSVSMLFKLSFY